jgi:hypothetical protein
MILGFAVLSACGGGPALAQTGGASMSPRVLGGGGGAAIVPNDPRLDPDSPESRAYAAQQKRVREIERELRLLQRRHFGTMRNTDRRELGLCKLRGFTEPAALLVMTELFDRERADVRTTILDHFASLESPGGDAALAWESVHGHEAWYRASAREHLARRLGAKGEAPPAVLGIIDRALRGRDDLAAVEGGRLASALHLYQFIPLMATAQAASPPATGERRGDLGWIMIGTQTAFVADLTPVVSNSAVGFDPQIGVVNDGTMLRIHDAHVTIYRAELHETLVEMTTDAWGRPTRSMGYDAGQWREWYENEFVPALAASKPADD